MQEALRVAFGVKGKSLSAALRRTGRRIPKRLHAEGQRIVDAQSLGEHPKLLRQLDGDALNKAEDKIVSYLSGIDRADRRKGMWLGIAGAVAFNVLLVLVGFIIWMVWSNQI